MTDFLAEMELKFAKDNAVVVRTKLETIRRLHHDALDAASVLLPDVSDLGWSSEAGRRYRERLGELRAEASNLRAALAVAELEVRLRVDALDARVDEIQAAIAAGATTGAVS